MGCKHETSHYELVETDYGLEKTLVTKSCFEDIDLHRYRCSQCGEIGYYSERAQKHFSGEKFDEMIEESNQRYLSRQKK